MRLPVHNVLHCTKAGASPLSIRTLTGGCPQIPEGPVSLKDFILGFTFPMQLPATFPLASTNDLSEQVLKMTCQPVSLPIRWHLEALIQSYLMRS